MPKSATVLLVDARIISTKVAPTASINSNSLNYIFINTVETENESLINTVSFETWIVQCSF